METNIALNFNLHQIIEKNISPSHQMIFENISLIHQILDNKISPVPENELTMYIDSKPSKQEPVQKRFLDPSNEFFPINGCCWIQQQQ